MEIGARFLFFVWYIKLSEPIWILIQSSFFFNIYFVFAPQRWWYGNYTKPKTEKVPSSSFFFFFFFRRSRKGNFKKKITIDRKLWRFGYQHLFPFFRRGYTLSKKLSSQFNIIIIIIIFSCFQLVLSFFVFWMVFKFFFVNFVSHHRRLIPYP